MGTVADFVESAWLVAVMLTDAGEGKSAGAVYKPAEEIVPTVAFPPGILLTLQDTPALEVLVTDAAKVWEFPKSTELLDGVTVTTTAGGGGGGVT